MNIARLLKAVIIVVSIATIAILLSIGGLYFIVSFGAAGVSIMLSLVVFIASVAMAYEYLGLKTGD